MAVAAVLAGGIASVVAFGIGSVLTPLFAWRMGTKLAVAAVSIPHFCATAYRFWLVRKSVDKQMLIAFGITSALGGLTGALLNAYATSPILTIIFGLLLLFAGSSELTGLAQRMRFHGPLAWLAGALSGLLGGLVGNQGGIRSAAMLGLDLEKESFVATATAVALAVDAARMPVYLATEFSQISHSWLPVLIGIIGAVIGTVLGQRFLVRISETLFRRSVAVLILALGLYMFAKGLLPILLH